MRRTVKAYAAGFLSCLMISATVAWAFSGGVMREVFYGVRVVINGVEHEFDWGMEPFIMDGRAFLPVRGIGYVLGVPVDWDDQTSTVYIGRRPQVREAGRTHLDVLTHSNIWTLDPVESTNETVGLAVRQIFDTLVVLDYDSMEVKPGLAVNWDMLDAQTVDMELRQGVTFHNGTPLTARDVQFSLERAVDSWSAWVLADEINYVEVHDDYNFTIHLREPFVPFLRNLAHSVLSIVSVDHYTAVGEEIFREQPIGTGPFVLYSNDLWGQEIRLVRNGNYWGELPQIETIFIQTVHDGAMRLELVAMGHADIALNIFEHDAAFAQTSPNVTLLRGRGFHVEYIGFNTRVYPFDNPLVARALNYALDTQAIVATVFYGMGLPASGPVANAVWGFAEMGPFEHNFERARELLIEAGYNTTPGEPGGLSTTIWYNVPNMQRMRIAEFMQFALAELNIDVEILGLEWAEYLERTAWGEHDMFILGWIAATGDADYSLLPLLHTSHRGAVGNRTFFSNAEVDALLEEARGELDPVRRAEIYARVMEIVSEHPPMIPVRQAQVLAVVANDLRGLNFSPMHRHGFSGVFFEE